MVKNKKDIIREKQLPGHSFRSGAVTLRQIIDSNFTNIGNNQEIPGDAVQDEKTKIAIASAIPADRLEKMLFQKPKKKELEIKRGMKFKHKPSGNNVIIIEANVDTTDKGEIRHRICVIGKSEKYLVPERSLVK